MTWRQVAAWRSGRHHLREPAPRDDLVGVVSELCGLHAQLLSSAELTLWARMRDLQRGDLERALWDDRSLVKLWAMRGTLHLLPSDEYPVWRAGLSTYRHFERPSWRKAFGVTGDELEAITVAVGDALEGRVLTRVELADEVAARTGIAGHAERLRGSWGAVLKPASFRGRLCFAPNDGQRVRFTNPASWLREANHVAHDRALDTIVRRYLAAHAPVSRADLARWWGVSTAAAGRLLGGLGDEAREVVVDGTPLWMLSEHVDEVIAARPSRTVRLLPAFDQYVVTATRQPDALVADRHRDRIYRPQGWLSPVLLVEGRMAGVWRHEQRGATVAVELEPFEDLPAWARRAAQEEAERLAVFLGGALDLTWSS